MSPTKELDPCFHHNKLHVVDIDEIQGPLMTFASNLAWATFDTLEVSRQEMAY